MVSSIEQGNTGIPKAKIVIIKNVSDYLSLPKRLTHKINGLGQINCTKKPE